MAQARHSGEFGLRVDLSGAPPHYVQDDSPNQERLYRARFYIQPGSIALGQGQEIEIFTGYDGQGIEQFSLLLRQDSGVRLVVQAFEDNGQGFETTTLLPTVNTWQFYEIRYLAASSPGANDGLLSAFINDQGANSLAGLDNDLSRIDSVRLGAITGPGTGGSFNLDDFVSTRSDTRIGPTAGAVGGLVSVGFYAPNTARFFLRNANATGNADLAFQFGAANSGFVPLAGDWDGDGVDTIGLYQPSSARFFLRNSNSKGNADLGFQFGPAGAGWIPIVGDWNNDGVTTIGLYDPAASRFYLRNSNSAGVANVTFVFGAGGAGWLPITGDWNGDGTTTIGLYAPNASRFYLRNANSTGSADATFVFGPASAGWTPIAGDWNQDGVTTVGLFAPSASRFYLRNANIAGPADITFVFGNANSGWIPLAGDWDGI